MSHPPETGRLSEIQHAFPLILNKVASPHYATPLLRRGRLIDWLNEAANCRAVVLAADAGYGKTTLLWQWEREVTFPCYWYKLDRNDRDWTSHISYLIESIAKRHDGFGRRAYSMLQQMGGPGSSRPGVAAYLLAEMHQRLTEPCTFLIDDWQYVNAVTEVRGLWNQIIRDAPPTCRFVFASRVKPKLQFARFKTHGGYAELRTDAFRFNEGEIGELFRDVYHDPLDPSELTELDRRTEGWAASLQLVEVSLRERTSTDARREFISSITATSDSALFEFLAEEVLDQQPEETRNFLLTTSILQQITPEVAERLAGIHDGRRELADLEHRGLFTSRLDEERYRYHNLFREFLERRLTTERPESEVVGLHIHAASYFETTHQWPEAIHHYLRAGLQRQAARLIAKYGEEVVANGGLGLVDEWLRQLPDESIRSNARLSLLFGEASGVRGDWAVAMDALERARAFFARKGDRRLQALACLKLSSVYINRGEIESAAECAEAAAVLLPADAAATRLRVQGNLALARTWLTQPIDAVIQECSRIATEAAATGFDHIAAIGYHNLGAALLHAGRYEQARLQLEVEAGYWAGPSTSPFADNIDLVTALLATGRPDQARQVADEAIRRTQPWPRPQAHARYGRGVVLMHDGRFDQAIREFSELVERGPMTGIVSQSAARLMEALYLDGRPPNELAAAGSAVDTPPLDDRYVADRAPGVALRTHIGPACRGRCQGALQLLSADRAHGSRGIVGIAAVKIGALAMEHRGRAARRQAWSAVAEATELGIAPMLRWWLRKFSEPRAICEYIEGSGEATIVARLAEADPDGWRTGVVEALKSLEPAERAPLLELLKRIANREVTARLSSISGDDVAAIRDQLIQQQAPRLYIRTFGRLSIRRGTWDGPEVRLEKKRLKSLVGFLAAHAGDTPPRDALIDRLWPEADADSAVNSLNQAVFQLRRHLDPEYRSGSSPEYLQSVAEYVRLNPVLVRVDLMEIGRLRESLPSLDWSARNRAAERILELVAGDFLPEFQYEDWASMIQLTITMRVREVLMPIALGKPAPYTTDNRLRASAALLRLDPFDEAALLALAESMARSGKRVAARDVVKAYAERVRAELDDEPSQSVLAALGDLGGAR